MGGVPSAELWDTRIYQITQLIVSKLKRAKKILFYGRSRDNGFVVFDGTENEMMEYCDIGNGYHTYKHLKLTFEIARNTSVFKGPRCLAQNKFNIKSYIKPTNYFHVISS